MPAASTSVRHPTNPFATRHTRPGRLPPLDEAGRPRNLGGLLAAADRLPAAAIVGPHGTGKSTLLVALERMLAASGRSAGLFRVRRRRDGLLVLPAVWRAAAGSTLCIDSWERLGRLERGAARLVAGIRGCRLLVTSHRTGWPPTLVDTSGSLAVLTAVVGRLPDHGGLLTHEDLAVAFLRHAGNIRDSLDELYDRFEHRLRRS